MPRDKADKI